MNKQIPAWALYLTLALSVVLLCGLTGVVATTTPEPKIETRTKTIEVENTEQIDDLKDEIDTLNTQLDICKKSTLKSTQGFIDMTKAFQTLALGAGNFDIDQVNEASSMIQAIDSAGIGANARLCDGDIATKITGMEDF